MTDYRFPFDKYTMVKIYDAISPKGKDVVQIYEDYWWIVWGDELFISKRSGGTLSNKNKELLSKSLTKLFKNEHIKLEIIQLPFVFLEWRD